MNHDLRQHAAYFLCYVNYMMNIVTQDRAALRYNSQKGQDLVEFALVIPVFLILLIGLFELGRMIYMKHNLDKATREAARAGAVMMDADQAELTADTVCRQVLDDLHMPADIKIDSKVSTMKSVDVVRVTATYAFQPMLTQGKFAVIPGIDLTSNSTMRWEG